MEKVKLSGNKQANAQGSVPAEVAAIVAMKLEAGQEKLSSLG